MYTPQQFAETDLSALDGLFARDAFITLISVVDGAPFASHLPVLPERDGERITVLGHWAKANPQWRSIVGQQVLMIVHGPHAYISPGWYTDPAAQVPTWNYAVAHLYGEIQILDDAASLQRIVSTLAERYERALGNRWRFPDSAPGQLPALAGIVGFRFVGQRTELKFKLSQNHPEQNIRGAIKGLLAVADDNAIATAALMQQRLDHSHPASGETTHGR
jgi:transcriptional regulator